MDATLRGIHVWVVDREHGVILERASFDTHGFSEESSALADYLRSIGAGAVVVMASRDEFTEHLTEEAVFMIEQLGSRLIRQVGYRDSYVFIGEVGQAESVVEAHQASMEGPTQGIEKTLALNPAQTPVTAQTLGSHFPNANGLWLRQRKNDGALNRVPVGFFPQVWSVLDQCQGLVIRHHTLPRDPTVLEKTAEEFNFALAVEAFLGHFVDPAERQVAVQILSIIYRDSTVLSLEQSLDLPEIMDRAIDLFWNTWAQPAVNAFSSHARALFFDLPVEGTESTETYIRLCLHEKFS
ncbi:hypothetical protein BY458DRAFT_144864 [Sporodiniella umbellata]|nr:hypothetical protein BY458DRAFT_144864 [Sporodiniella umbellata]